jgi:hypothetical protein
MLAHSSQWPEDWNGYELRWLAAAAFDFEQDFTHKRDRRRYASFKNLELTTTLY